MKKLLMLSAILLGGCTGTSTTNTEFDWMPNDLLWQHNVIDCRSQPQCNPADLFTRT